MKIDLDVELKGYDGEPIIPDGDGKTALTLKDACCEALMLVFKDEKVDGKTKLTRHMLAQRIHGGGEQDLGVDDLALMRKLIGKAYGPRVVGPSWILLNGKDKPETPSE